MKTLSARLSLLSVLFFSFQLNSQIDFKFTLEPNSAIVWKNDQSYLNLTNYNFSHEYHSNANLGLEISKKLNEKGFYVGLSGDTRYFRSEFRFKYNELIGVDNQSITYNRQRSIRHYFHGNQIKVSALAGLRKEKWHFQLKFGGQFGFNRNSKPDVFFQISSTDKQFLFREDFNAAPVYKPFELSADYLISNRFSFGFRTDFHIQRGRNFYSLYIRSNELNEDFNRDMVSITLKNHRMSFAWRVSYRFSAFKKKEKLDN